MAYKVVITLYAERDLESAAMWYTQISPEIASHWREEMIHHIFSLEENALLYPIAHEESLAAGRQLRCLLHGKKSGQYRILFEVVQNTVSILSIRHSSRERLQSH